eukprot:5120306-Ditylum_brightwellii.AAC.1
MTETPYSTREFYFTPQTGRIIPYTSGNFTAYKQATNRSTLYVIDNIIMALLLDAIRTIAYCLGPCLSSSAATASIPSRTNATRQDPTAFISYLHTLPEHVQHFLGNLHHQQVNADYWITALQQGEVHIATNGLVAGKKGYF